MDAKRKEPKQISFRVSETEYDRLKEVAEGMGISVTQLAKKRTMGTRLKVPKVNRAAGLAIASELRRIGVNLNQVAKHANENQMVLNDDLSQIREDLKAIWQQFN